MKKAIWALTFLVYSTIWANPDPEITDLRIGSINGQVIENHSGNPVAYAANVFKSLEDGSTIPGGITKDDGSFELKKLPEGTFQLEVQFIGYKTHSREITISKKNRNLELGVITLNEEAVRTRLRSAKEEIRILKEPAAEYYNL